MKMISNEGGKFWKLPAIFLVILAILIVALAAFFLVKKVRQVKFSKPLSLDSTEDNRALGYSGQRKIAQDEKGNTYLAYRRKYQGVYEIFVSIVSANSLKKIQAVEQPAALVGGGANQRVPSIVADGKGTVHMVWYGADSGIEENNRQIKYARSNDQGKTWTEWKNISIVDGYEKGIFWQEHPFIYAGQDSSLYVVWEGRDSTHANQQIKISSSTDGGDTWSQWRNIEETAENAQSRPSLAEDSAGNIHLFMYSSAGNEKNDYVQQIKYARSEDKGNSWSPWKEISNPVFDSRHLSVAADAGGNIHAVWREADSLSEFSEIKYRELASTGDWQDIKTVSFSKSYNFFPSISIDKNEQPIIAWMETDKNSGLPQEDPQQGWLRGTFLKNDSFVPIAGPPFGESGLYPNLMEKTGEKKSNYLLYLKNISGETKFSLVLRIFSSK